MQSPQPGDLDLPRATRDAANSDLGAASGWFDICEATSPGEASDLSGDGRRLERSGHGAVAQRARGATKSTATPHDSPDLLRSTHETPRCLVSSRLRSAVPASCSAAASWRSHARPCRPHDHSFADADRYAKSFDDPARDAWQMPDRVIAALGLKPGQSVADIGAGTGYFSVRLAKSAAKPKVFGVDIEANMVQYLRQRAMQEGLTNVVAVKADADKTNLPEPVDVVLIVDTYHHIGNRVA